MIIVHRGMWTHESASQSALHEPTFNHKWFCLPLGIFCHQVDLYGSKRPCGKLGSPVSSFEMIHFKVMLSIWALLEDINEQGGLSWIASCRLREQ